MKNDKVWDKIDASPLLQLPPEQRKALHEAGDEGFRTLWGDCFAAALTLGRPVDGGDFCRIFLKAFDFWVPKPGQTFSAYLRSALKHQNAHDAQQEQMAVTGFGRETNRKIKNALAYMAKNQITEEKLCHDPEKEQLVADIAGVGVKTLREALRNKQSILSLDGTDGEETALETRVAAPAQSVEEQAEQTGELLAWLHRGIGLMSLQQKEQYGKTAGPLWSSVLLGFCATGTCCPRQRIPPRGWQTAMICVRWNRTTVCGTSCCYISMWRLPFSRPMRPKRWNAPRSTPCWTRSATRRRIRPWQNFLV